MPGVLGEVETEALQALLVRSRWGVDGHQPRREGGVRGSRGTARDRLSEAREGEDGGRGDRDETGRTGRQAHGNSSSWVSPQTSRSGSGHELTAREDAPRRGPPWT